jgi:hypothetical protein
VLQIGAVIPVTALGHRECDDSDDDDDDDDKYLF